VDLLYHPCGCAGQMLALERRFGVFNTAYWAAHSDEAIALRPYTYVSFSLSCCGWSLCLLFITLMGAWGDAEARQQQALQSYDFSGLLPQDGSFIGPVPIRRPLCAGVFAGGRLIALWCARVTARGIA